MPQTRWLKRQKFNVSQVLGTADLDQGLSRLVSSKGHEGESAPETSALASGGLLTVFGNPWPLAAPL